jgi:predicted O-linked N-acetylglucosamine transferase (SPINDLY family)
LRDYLSLYHQVDISLDTLPYNGHTTTLDSLWMGVPVISQLGTNPVGRAGLSILSNLGLESWVAATDAEFVELAKGLSGNAQKLREIRSTLRDRMQRSPLMDAVGFTRNFELACRQMWRTWCSDMK